jgi:hypothetical protein
MRLQILGSGDAFGSGGRLNTCFMVQRDAASFLIDCGASVMVSCFRAQSPTLLVGDGSCTWQRRLVFSRLFSSQPPTGRRPIKTPKRTPPRRGHPRALFRRCGRPVASAMWACLNLGLVIFFSFGPAMLREQAVSATGAAALTSSALWVLMFSVPLGGFLVERSGRTNLAIIAFSANRRMRAWANARRCPFTAALHCVWRCGRPTCRTDHVLAIARPQCGATGGWIWPLLHVLLLDLDPWAGSGRAGARLVRHFHIGAVPRRGVLHSHRATAAIVSHARRIAAALALRRE